MTPTASEPCPVPGCGWMCVSLDADLSGEHLTDHLLEAHGLVDMPDRFTDAPWPPPDEIDPESLVTNGPILIWDDPPPDPDRPIDHEVLLEWYRQHRGPDAFDPESLLRTPINEAMEDHEVRCGTWLYPAAMAALAAGVVYLSYRWTNR